MPSQKFSQISNTVIKNLIVEAQKNKIRVWQVDPEFFTFCLEYKGRRHYIFHKKIGLNTANSALVSNKYLTLKILDRAGIAVPRAYLVEDLKDIKRMLRRRKIKYPFVIKPYDYSLGVAVTPNIQNEQMSKMAISRIKLYWKKAAVWGKKKKRRIFMVEEHVKGSDYRILVLNNKVIAASQRAYPEVIGNGKNSLWRLIQNYYANHPYYIRKKKRPLIDAELKRNLKMQHVKFSDILPKGKIIRLRQTANVFGGGKAINVTDKINPYYKKIALTACKELGLNFAGVDLMTSDIAKKNDYRVIEINSFPSLDMHEHPDQGKPINVSWEILKAIFPKLK